MTQKTKVAVVSGANRGIGLEVTRQLAEKGWLVIALGRDLHKIGPAITALQQQGLRVEPRRLDVISQEDCKALAKWLFEKELQVDALINNAGILKENQADGSADALRIEPALIMETINTNTLGPLRLIQTLEPRLREHARIVNVSSGMGQLSSMGDGYLAYRLSKTALNALTRVMSNRLAERKIQVNAVCPGWVKTDMGGANAERDVKQGADTIVWLASSEDVTTSGGFFRDRQPIDW